MRVGSQKTNGERPGRGLEKADVEFINGNGVSNALAKAGIELGENGSIFPRPAPTEAAAFLLLCSAPRQAVDAQQVRVPSFAGPGDASQFSIANVTAALRWRISPSLQMGVRRFRAADLPPPVDAIARFPGANEPCPRHAVKANCPAK